MFESSQEQDLKSFGIDKKYTQTAFLQRGGVIPTTAVADV